jgi:hypothetical protein
MMSLLIALTGALNFVAKAQTYNWKPVRIGGGGNVTSIKAHPKVPNLYFITTDVGTPYRWNHAAQKWEDMMWSGKIPTTMLSICRKRNPNIRIGEPHIST